MSTGTVTVQAMWAGGDARLLLRDATGRLERDIPMNGIQGRTLQLEGLTQGVHLLELRAGDRREVIRLVVAE